MNKARRNQITKILAKLEELEEFSQDIMLMIDEVREEEQDAYDNLPEGIQAGERGEKMEEAISNLEAAYSEIEDSLSQALDEVREYLENAQD